MRSQAQPDTASLAQQGATRASTVRMLMQVRPDRHKPASAGTASAANNGRWQSLAHAPASAGAASVVNSGRWHMFLQALAPQVL